MLRSFPYLYAHASNARQKFTLHVVVYGYMQTVAVMEISGSNVKQVLMASDAVAQHPTLIIVESAFQGVGKSPTGREYRLLYNDCHVFVRKVVSCFQS